MPTDQHPTPAQECDPIVRVQLHPAQAAFFQSTATVRGYVGGRGAGKSWIGAFDLLCRALQRKELYGMYAPTYPMLRDTSLRSFLAIAEPYIADFRKADGVIELVNGSEILCRSLDDPERARGPNLAGAWVEEASLIGHMAYLLLMACLRAGGVQGWLSNTFTPKGKGHWTYRELACGDPAIVQLFTSKTSDNPFLPPTMQTILRSLYPARFAAQELSGEFVDAEGNMFSRSWFPIVDDWPRAARMLRYWDMAATAPRKGRDPDWSAGALVGLLDGVWYIVDMRRAQITPERLEQLIKGTALSDGVDVPVRAEEEGGASGKGLVSHYARNVLVGFDFKGVRPSGNKVARAMPFSAAAEAGNVRLVRGSWNDALLDELETFPDDGAGMHDDQVDAISGAMTELAGGWINPTVTAAGAPSGWPRPYDPATADMAELQKLLLLMNPIQRAEIEREMAGKGMTP